MSTMTVKAAEYEIEWSGGAFCGSAEAAVAGDNIVIINRATERVLEFFVDDEEINTIEAGFAFVFLVPDGKKVRSIETGEEYGKGKVSIYLEDMSAPDDVKDSGSNDDDSRPAPPTPHQSAQTSILSSVDTQLAKIDASADGQVIVDGKDLVNALPNTTMQKIAEKPNAVVFFTYTYNDAKYTTAIPGSSVDTSIEWYGPIYMMTHFPTMWHQDANTSVPVVAPVQ